MCLKPSSFLAIALLFAGVGPVLAGEGDPATRTRTYAIVDTGQVRCYDARREIRYPADASGFGGQDAQYRGNEPAYRDLKDGTVIDRVTGLMWQKSPGSKKTFKRAVGGAAKCRAGGHRDWRLPTIKELYSLILFSGVDVDPNSRETTDQHPFIDTRYFDFSYGDPSKGERIIDSQWATSTKYVSTTMNGDATMFGVNFADGRIKGYGLRGHPGRGEKTFYCIYVRGNPRYGRNDFKDKGDGTITDRATGLTWMKQDSGHLRGGPNKNGRMNWKQALAWAERLTHAGYSDWRLPNAKELQSIVDYTRSPDTTQSAAIDAMFDVPTTRDERRRRAFPSYWSSTTHMGRSGSAAAYVAFGRSGGWMRSRRGGGDYRLLDVHGAGSQRSDPKDGNPADYPRGRGPQGDVIRILNHVRCVRGGKATPASEGPELLATGGGRERPGDREGAPGPAGREPGGARFVDRLDRDGDGKVSKKEFDGPAGHFRDFDRNRDG
ncbi:MAG: DUF1566 domain-containing protein, partial [bacterium]|nr:DUF1566 domain-containing protein [bacterium]